MLKPSLTSTSVSGYRVEQCIDGDTTHTFDGVGCQTQTPGATGDNNPRLSILYPCASGNTSLSKVEVYSSSGSTYISRLRANFVINFYGSVAGSPVQFSYPFNGQGTATTTLYTFNPPTPSPPTP